MMTWCSSANLTLTLTKFSSWECKYHLLCWQITFWFKMKTNTWKWQDIFLKWCCWDGTLTLELFCQGCESWPDYCCQIYGSQRALQITKCTTVQWTLDLAPVCSHDVMDAKYPTVTFNIDWQISRNSCYNLISRWYCSHFTVMLHHNDSNQQPHSAHERRQRCKKFVSLLISPSEI